MREPYFSAAWQLMTREDETLVWERFYQTFSFKPSIYRQDWPVFVEPSPSITYCFAYIWPLYRNAPDVHIQLVHDWETKTLAAFRRYLAPQDGIFALDWQHQCYEFYPHKTKDSEPWTISIVPNGDYHIFIARDFSFGVLGHPWQHTVCVFGQSLLDAFENAQPAVFRRAVRRNGHDVDPAHSITWKFQKDRAPNEAFTTSKTFANETFVEISVVENEDYYEIHTVAKDGDSVSTQPRRAYDLSPTTSLQWALRIVSEECDLWDQDLD